MCGREIPFHCILECSCRSHLSYMCVAKQTSKVGLQGATLGAMAFEHIKVIINIQLKFVHLL